MSMRSAEEGRKIQGREGRAPKRVEMVRRGESRRGGSVRVQGQILSTRGETRELNSLGPGLAHVVPSHEERMQVRVVQQRRAQ